MIQHIKVSVIKYFNKINNKNHNYLNRHPKKSFDKTQHPFVIKKKKFTKLGIKGNDHNIIKSIH